MAIIQYTTSQRRHSGFRSQSIMWLLGFGLEDSGRLNFVSQFESSSCILHADNNAKFRQWTPNPKFCDETFIVRLMEDDANLEILFISTSYAKRFSKQKRKPRDPRPDMIKLKHSSAPQPHVSSANLVMVCTSAKEKSSCRRSLLSKICAHNKPCISQASSSKCCGDWPTWESFSLLATGNYPQMLLQFPCFTSLIKLTYTFPLLLVPSPFKINLISHLGCLICVIASEFCAIKCM
jgi:hypothetical protein